MADWRLQLTEDVLRRTHPVFPTLAERIAAYEDFYFPSVNQVGECSSSLLAAQPACRLSGNFPYVDLRTKKAPSHKEAAPEPYARHSFPESAALDVRQTQSPFSTLLCFYDTMGNEYTFSQAGMRHVRRSLPWQGHYHTHDYIEILLCLKGNFRQILLGEPRTFCAGEVVITDKNLEHADMLEGGANTAVLFLSLQADYLDHLLSSHDSQDDLQRFFFHALQKQRKEQSYIHLRPNRESDFSPDGRDTGHAVHAAASRASGHTAHGTISHASDHATDGTTVSGSSHAPDHAAISPASGHTTDGITALQLSRLLETLIEEDYFPSPGSEDIIRGSLIRLLSLLCRQYSTRLHSSDQESKERALLYELERYLRLHFATVTASELEEVFHYHRNFYNLLLQKYRGITFREYLQDIRMRHAAKLLRNTRFPVRDIALSAGYHNSSHFYHLFERYFGVSPAVYREHGQDIPLS